VQDIILKAAVPLPKTGKLASFERHRRQTFIVDSQDTRGRQLDT